MSEHAFVVHAWRPREMLGAEGRKAWIQEASAWFGSDMLRPHRKKEKDARADRWKDAHARPPLDRGTKPTETQLERVLQEHSLYAGENEQDLLHESDFERDLHRAVAMETADENETDVPAELVLETKMIRKVVECMERQDRCAGASSVPEPYLGFIKGKWSNGTMRATEITPFRPNHPASQPTRGQRFHQREYREWIQQLKNNLREEKKDAQEPTTIGGVLVRSGVGVLLPRELQAVLSSNEQEGSNPTEGEKCEGPCYVVVVDALRSRQGQPTLEVYSLWDQRETLFECA